MSEHRAKPFEFQIVPLDSVPLEDVVALEEATMPIPWSESGILAELFVPHGVHRGALSPDGALAGYIFSHLILDELSVLNIVTAPNFRRQGVATQLLQATLRDARGRGGKRAFLEVRVSNLSAQALYLKQGFQETARRRGYYPDNGEDALILEMTL